jgi:ubiquitin C-terminal hydrolase
MSQNNQSNEPYCKLRNFGNTCYYNAMHQCLMSSFGFYNLIANNMDQFKINKDKYNLSILEELNEVFTIMNENPGEIMRPRKLISTLDNIMKSRKFEVTAQNDSHELYMLLIERIFDETKQQMNPDNLIALIHHKYHQNGLYTRYPKEIIEICAQNWKHEFQNSYCPLTDVVFGQFLRTTVCANPICNNKSYASSVFRSLELPITQPTLQGCLNDAFLPHTVSFTCDKCNQHDECQSNDQIWMEPNILVVQVKRYEYKQHQRGIRIMKNEASVAFDKSNTITLNTLAGQKQYKFRGIVCHMGQYEGGHYVAFVYNSKTQKYYCLNDTSCNEVSYEEIPMNQLCLAIYEK